MASLLQDAVTVRFVPTPPRDQLRVMWGHRLAVSHLFFNGKTIASAAIPREDFQYPAENEILVWNAADGASRCILKGGSNLNHLDYKDGITAGVYADNKVRVWDVRNCSRLHAIYSGVSSQRCLRKDLESEIREVRQDV
ncbi:TAF5-like RNA polymerase II p300/CBP-associated factor-associated factor 65 kDa subunit 5L [Patiria miniata]|uniref:Uncharacterized protein n=1 Tax=Patiria miniata TaxID=46514 RepID=A0A913ZP10_PATMI|nr:TAF5-like RNA polymerase II p300/CBP-associated factor-associated factor 65 kDa subunit 5L [Patiria miniata]